MSFLLWVTPRVAAGESVSASWSCLAGFLTKGMSRIYPDPTETDVIAGGGSSADGEGVLGTPRQQGMQKTLPLPHGGSQVPVVERSVNP